MSEIKDVDGILWGDGAIANARWTDVALQDVLDHAGLFKDLDTTGMHVCFASYAEVCENNEIGTDHPSLSTRLWTLMVTSYLHSRYVLTWSWYCTKGKL